MILDSNYPFMINEYLPLEYMNNSNHILQSMSVSPVMMSGQYEDELHSCLTLRRN